MSMMERTVYRNSNALGQLVPICSHKRWYLSELVELQIVGAKRTLGAVGVNNLEVKLVCLGNGSNSLRSYVRLKK